MIVPIHWLYLLCTYWYITSPSTLLSYCVCKEVQFVLIKIAVLPGTPDVTRNTSKHKPWNTTWNYLLPIRLELKKATKSLGHLRMEGLLSSKYNSNTWTTAVELLFQKNSKMSFFMQVSALTWIKSFRVPRAAPLRRDLCEGWRIKSYRHLCKQLTLRKPFYDPPGSKTPRKPSIFQQDGETRSVSRLSNT